MSERIILGSRGSQLARAQTHLVEQALQRAWPELEIVIEIIRTSGDEGPPAVPIGDRKAGRKGLFTREIEKELLVRRIEVAVHSAKDLPSQRVDDFEVRATLPRAGTQDILITKTDVGLTTVPAGAVIATGSVRRQHQLRWKRPDLQIAELRGNVPTRLRKLRESENWSGIILARAGLERLGAWNDGADFRMTALSEDDFVPAGGQGVIALQVRRDDQKTQRIVDAINNQSTLICLRAEREFLRLLDGDCDSPVGVHAKCQGEQMNLRAQIFEAQSIVPRTATITGAKAEPEAVAADLMKKLYGG